MALILRDSDTQEQIETTNIEYSDTFENEATTADIELLSDTQSQNLSQDQQVEIYNTASDNIEFTGIVKDLPENYGVNEITVKQNYRELIELDANGRIFYNEDSGAVLRKLITEDIESRGSELLYDGSSTTNIATTAPVGELANFKQIRPEEFGTDLYFVGFPKQETTETVYTVTLDSLSFTGEELQEIETRLIINNLSNIFDIQVQYVDDSNKNYVWELGKIDGEVSENLSVAKAENKTTANTLDPDTNANKLRFIISVDGKLVESRALLIDSIVAKSIDIIDRSTSFDTINIPNSGRDITRKFNRSVSEAVYNILTEEPRNLRVEGGSVFRIEKGGTEADLELIEGVSPVIGWTKDSNPDRVINKITVEGSNDVYVQNKSQTSIDEYGVKSAKVRDFSITNQNEAEQKTRQILEDNAWKDTILSFYIAKTQEVSDLQVGQNVYINFDSIDNQFVLIEINKESSGWVELKFEAESRRL